jgi:hypothetical protein
MKMNLVQIVIVASVAVFLGSSASADAGSGSVSSRKISGIEALRLTVGESFLHARARIIRFGWDRTPRVRRESEHDLDLHLSLGIRGQYKIMQLIHFFLQI